MISWLKWLLGHVKAWFQVIMGVSHPETRQMHMNDPPVTASLGPIDRLISQLQSLEGYKHSLPVELSAKQIGLLIKHLREFCNPMKILSEMEDTGFIDKWWMKEVRDLCYDTEDYLDEVMMQYGAGAPRTWTHLLLEDARIPAPIGRIAGVIIFWIHTKFKWRPQLSHFLARAQVLKGRCPSSAVKEIKADISINTEIKADISLKKEDRADIKTLTAQLLDMLAFDDKQTQLKVVPICGFEGAGKTILVTTLYAKYKKRFQCWAFVRVSRNPDIRSILISILSQIKAPPASTPMSQVQDLILSISTHLKTKRYFVVIDDIRRTSVWDIISRALPCDNCGSRIIITTESEHLASACSGYYLGSSIFQVDALNACTDAITSEEKKKDIDLRYNKLPLHLKTCLLFLGMHPEGCTLMKNDLVKQWVAEDFIPALKRQDREEIPQYKKKEILDISQHKTEVIAAVPEDQTEEIAHGYFDELVTRGMILPVDRNHKGEVLSCKVHHNILDLIRYKSKEGNFFVVVDNLESTLGHPDIVRRLSVQFGCEKGASIPESIILSQVRSLTFYGFLECVPSLADYGLLRVLIMSIWADQDNISDLTRIGELYHLRYLKIECNVTVRLPSKIRRLQYLGTLELHADVVAIPSDIGHLQNLMHVLCPSKPDVSDLGEVSNLLDLQLTWSTHENLEDDMECLCSILEKLSSLRCLALLPASGPCSVNTLPANPSRMCISCDSLLIVSPASANIQRLELSHHCCIFSRLPEWIGKLGKLCFLKIAVGYLLMEDIDILKRMPSLTALTLHVQTRAAKMIVFGKGGFSVLTYFKFTCNVPWIKFEAGAMPNLEKLKLCFDSPVVDEQGITRIIIIERLKGLEEISAIIGSAGADAESAWQEAIESDPKNPTVQLMGSIYSSDQGRGMETRKGSGEDESNEADIRVHTKPESSRLHVPGSKAAREDSGQDENTKDDIRMEAEQRLLDHILRGARDPPCVPMSLLREITGNFSYKRKIGVGGYGEVYKGVFNEHEIAVKRFFAVHGPDDEGFDNQFRNLIKVQHKNVIRLIGYCYEIAHRNIEYGGKLVWSQIIDRALCFEYMKRGRLDEHISDESCIHDWPTTYKIINGICEGLHHLHNGGETRIFHLDLNPTNVLLDEELVPKIGGFGLSMLILDSYTDDDEIISLSVKGTFGFMPQEYICGRVVSPKNDVFSLGVTIFHTMVGKKGYGDYRDMCHHRNFFPKVQHEFVESVQEYWKKKMKALEGYRWDETDLLGVKKCIEIARRCVEDDRDKRPLIAEIVGELKELDSKIKEMLKEDPKPLIQQLKRKSQ